jgi:hypothetical protein
MRRVWQAIRKDSTLSTTPSYISRREGAKLKGKNAKHFYPNSKLKKVGFLAQFPTCGLKTPLCSAYWFMPSKKPFLNDT